MKQSNLREAFIGEFKQQSCNGNAIVEIYRHLFTSMEHDSLESLLTCLRDEVNDEHWFYNFHKSMRQTDFFSDVFVPYYIDNRTEDDIKRMAELKKILPFHDVSDAVKTEKAIELGLESEMNEYRLLKKKSKIEKRRCISGNLDMVLWNLIHMDKSDFLKRFIERFFKLQQIEELL